MKKLVPLPIPILLLALQTAPPAHAAETPRQSVAKAMILRPNDPWPRGKGHVVLAAPGSREEFKAYHEPGGSFSPAFGSFGVSFWVTDYKDRLITTSDAIPLDQIEQKLVWPEQPVWPKRLDVPGVETKTPHYDALWSFASEGRWQLRLRTKGTNSIWLVVRSVGPAGAPMSSLHWLSDKLYVNDRWTLSFSKKPVEVEVVPPKNNDPLKPGVGEVKWPAERDWGYARFKLLKGQEHWLTIEDAVIQPTNPIKFSHARVELKLALPDKQFVDSLNAQVAHLMMGLVSNETRPGDPNNYPLNWLRDGAYEIVALARAGQLETAKQLCGPFATNDFFGGFGSEADGPGLALWALGEVSAMAKDSKFDGQLWPHVQRKAALILEMLSAKEPLRKPFVGPIVPQYMNRNDLDLVCEPAKDGLIVGKMDWQRPILFVNAVSYRGLLSAASLAERLKKEDDANGWRDRAAQMRQAWWSAFNSRESDNERTYVCSLHPTWIVSDREAYEKKLAERRAKSHDAQDQLKEKPLWTYFNIAEAHQWLALGQPEKTWNDLRWFWSNQASPGLYTWWEGNGEENTFHRWEQVRGWITPPHVTPHYWTAAEMLLLQLDMLVCLDESGGEPTLVVGAGVPKEWLEKPLSVEGLLTRLGQVDWEWKKSRLTVKLDGFKCAVKSGPAFLADTVLKVKD
jgi:hypothetical protein